ncbi:hypothetical protein DL96DRAFT_1644530 [Flagelloscypha sp. PMI_526]|nr:hypothetical protein DL96DRAFT_1644530 [Flagelloscypha sp. PMI_526]
MSCSELPLELVLLILALAARLDKETQLSLTYVSKEIQDIGDRVLYEDIFVGYTKTYKMLKQMLMNSCTNPRLLRARRYITSFRTDAYLGTKTLDNLFIHCTNLRLFAMMDVGRKSPIRAEPPSSLRTIGIRQLWDPEVFVSEFRTTVLFRNVTRLVIEQIDYGDLRPLFHASNLTHLFLGCTLKSLPPWRSGRQMFPPRLRLCLVYLGFIKDPISDLHYYNLISRSSFSEIQEGLTDNRFVPVVLYRHSRWRGRSTCRGFLVGPDCPPGPGISGNWTPYAVRFEDRKPIYDWLKSAWGEGEEIVSRRERGEAFLVCDRDEDPAFIPQALSDVRQALKPKEIDRLPSASTREGALAPMSQTALGFQPARRYLTHIGRKVAWWRNRL